MLVSACVKGKCETCTKTIGGIAGSILIEERVVCDENQIKELEESSSGTTVWSCEE
ncbi:MAG: hypothetical protein L3J35_10840 [Bacteroidales bacterium]|nr:hypothetical protein [Bacteroidales bacterium]